MATKHGSPQHSPQASLPLSTLGRKAPHEAGFINAQSIHLTVFGNRDNMKRSEGVWLTKTVPFYHQCGQHRETRRRARAESVTKPPASLLTSDPGLLRSWLAPWPPTPLQPYSPPGHLLSVMLPQLKHHLSRGAHGTLPTAHTPTSPSPGKTYSTWSYQKELLCFCTSSGNTVINNFKVILLQQVSQQEFL